MTLKEVEAAAIQLSREERLQLAQALTDSVRSEFDPAVDRAWVLIATQRLQEIQQGQDVLVDGDDAMREAYSVLNGPV